VRNGIWRARSARIVLARRSASGWRQGSAEALCALDPTNAQWNADLAYLRAQLVALDSVGRNDIGE